MFWLKLVSNFLKILRAGQTPRQIAGGFALGYNVGLRLWNTEGSFDIAFSTDLDALLATRTKRVIGDEITRLQNELRGKVNQKIAEKRQEFERLFNQKKDEVLAQLKAYENLVNEKIAMVEGKKKELEARIE